MWACADYVTAHQNKPLLAQGSQNMATTTYNSDTYDVLNLPQGYRGIQTDTFHKFLTFHGIPILASHSVNNFAVQEARWTLEKMFEKADHRIATLRASNLFITILPNIHGGLYNLDLDNANIILVGEENLIDPDAKASILIHEVAHAVHHSLCEYEKNYINQLYENRPSWGTPHNYAQENAYEYFAEGVTAFFSAGMPAEPVNKKSTLKLLDTPLHSTINAIFEWNPFTWQPVNQRKTLSEHVLNLKFSREPTQILKEYHD